MTTTLYGWTWVGDDEPTTGVLATQDWRKPTTGERFSRNTSNTAWVVDGNVNSRLGGAVEVAGSTMTSALLGATNLPPLTDPDFIGTIRQGGFPVALMTALAALEKRVYDRIIYQIREQWLSNLRRSVIGSVMAFGYGTVAAKSAVPLPTYDDGISATIGEVVVLMGSLKHTGDFEQVDTMNCYIDATTLIAHIEDGTGYDGDVNYIIICLR
jgi:hypothetical protein